jgi:hypothetical protein
MPIKQVELFINLKYTSVIKIVNRRLRKESETLTTVSLLALKNRKQLKKNTLTFFDNFLMTP